MDTDTIKLNCWIRGQEISTFSVKISRVDTVEDLAEAIKEKKSAAFRDVDADTLKLYKPRDPLPRPYEQNLCRFILSEDAELLEIGDEDLSEVFQETPLKHHIHLIVDAPPEIECWFRGKPLNASFGISIQVGTTTSQVKEYIKRTRPSLGGVPEEHILLYRIPGDENELRDSLTKPGEGEPLERGNLLANFVSVPVLDPLHVVIEVPEENLSPTLHQEPIHHADALQKYQDIFLKVENWGKLDEGDLGRNQITKAETIIPPFVTDFEQMLLRKPRLPFHVLPEISEEYFEPHQTSTANVEEELRCADLMEVMHTTYHVVGYKWQDSWNKKPLKQPLMNSIFFDAFLHTEDRENTILVAEPWPLSVIVKRDDKNDKELRKYQPRSDFLIKIASLPRLLVEVNSTHAAESPRDLYRMLATGAFIVRFANNFVSTFIREKNFVLCAFFIWGNGLATRHILFQKEDDKVYYRERNLQLSGPNDRVEFVRHLYNLRAESAQTQDQATKDAVTELNEEIRQRKLKSMYTKTDRSKKRKLAEINNDDPAGGGRAGGGRGNTAQLRAHGYEVEPKDFVDESGGRWESLSKTPDHILTVYRPANPKKVFIAKKVREESDELEILKLLGTTQLKSNHVISLVDSFDGWAILPKMTTLEDYLVWTPKAFESKVLQVCLGLVDGLAYLHGLGIAHRDIKPSNLVVDKNLTLQIIDFDVAMRVKDEDEEVNDQCGTEGWMAPEVANRLKHSPIKADRWSCGRVVLLLLDTSGEEDVSLRAFARDLVAHDPKQRPPLLERGRYLAVSDAGNIGNCDASKTSLRRDRVECDGESTKPPNVKKQRLDGGFRGRYGLGPRAEGRVELVK